MMSPADAEKFMKLPDEIRNLRSVVEALPEPSLRAEIAEAQALDLLERQSWEPRILHRQMALTFEGLMPQATIRLVVDRALLRATTEPDILTRRTDDVQAYLQKVGTKGACFSFGIPELDAAYGGLRPAEIMSLVAPEGSGKTSLLLRGLQSFYENTDGKLVHCNMDMTREGFTERRLAIGVGCYPRDVSNEAKANTERYRKAVAALKAQEERIVVLHGPRTLEQMERDILENSPDLVSIDYLSAIAGDFKGDYDLVRAAIRKIRGWRERWGISFIILSQMGRASKADLSKGSRGSHALGGGDIERVADCEIELQKDAVSEGSNETRYVATVTKARYAKAGRSFELDFDVNSLQFRSFSWELETLKERKPIFGQRRGWNS